MIRTPSCLFSLLFSLLLSFSHRPDIFLSLRVALPSPHIGRRFSPTLVADSLRTLLPRSATSAPPTRIFKKAVVPPPPPPPRFPAFAPIRISFLLLLLLLLPPFYFHPSFSPVTRATAPPSNTATARHTAGRFPRRLFLLRVAFSDPAHSSFSPPASVPHPPDRAATTFEITPRSSRLFLPCFPSLLSSPRRSLIFLLCFSRRWLATSNGCQLFSR